MILFLKKLTNKFKAAFNGLLYGLRYDRSILLQCLIGLIVITIGFFLQLNSTEWLWLLVIIVLVIATEFINSAIEELVDMISPNYDERAKIIKDYAACGVMIVSFGALLVAIWILTGGLR